MWTNLCVDDFFNDPDKVVKLASNLEYYKDGYSPGVRSSNMAEIDKNFFNSCCNKILSLFYPNEYRGLLFSATAFFHKVDPNTIDSWVHQDKDSVLTAIVYLNKNLKAGTSLMKKKQFTKNLQLDYTNIKYDYFKSDKQKDKKVLEAQKKHLKDFDETVIYYNEYNRLIAFDALQHHMAHENKEDETRLTYITFFKKVDHIYDRFFTPIEKSKTI